MAGVAANVVVNAPPPARAPREICIDWLARRFELSRGGSESNIRPMEGLRGFAVTLVFLVHFVTLIRPWLSGDSGFLAFANAIHAVGNSGVDLFFVLSGYLIYGSLISRPQPFLRFMSRRVVRIYPAFLAVLATYVMLSLLLPAESKIPATGGFLYLLQNILLLPGLFPIEPMITVAWSLSYEMFFYLLIPLVIALFRLRDWPAGLRTAFFVSAASATAGYCAVNGGPVRLIMFISGIVLSEAVKMRRMPSPSSLIGLLALAAGLQSMLLPVEGHAGISFKVCFLFLAFFVLCLSCFRNPYAWLSRAFSWTPLRWLGNMSYSYYLVHGLALKAAFLALASMLPAAPHGPWSFWILLAPMFALTLIPSSALFLLVERPLSLAPA